MRSERKMKMRNEKILMVHTDDWPNLYETLIEEGLTVEKINAPHFGNVWQSRIKTDSGATLLDGVLPITFVVRDEPPPDPGSIVLVPIPQHRIGLEDFELKSERDEERLTTTWQFNARFRLP